MGLKYVFARAAPAAFVTVTLLAKVLTPVRVWLTFSRSTLELRRASGTVPLARAEASRSASPAPLPRYSPALTVPPAMLRPELSHRL